ncbi:MAG: ATP-dependent helicase HrpB, partial [Ketobacter sp.]
MLPIDDILPQLIQASKEHHCVVLQAPPGAGKTTRVPLALLACEWLRGKIVVIQPRRLAVYSAAHRLAQQLGESPGTRVGYRTRYDHCVAPANRIEVVT